MSDGVFAAAARDWGRWGAHDEIGRANLLTPDVVLAAAASIRSGRRFSLALPLCAPGGDPRMPGRPASEHRMLRDHSHYLDGRARDALGGMRFTDDWLGLACHGTTHLDALGHSYEGDALWNGHPAASTVGGLDRADIASIARQGVVGRAVLVDVARHLSVDRIARGTHISIDDVVGALRTQSSDVRPGDTLLLRTGTAPHLATDAADPVASRTQEPGLTYEPALIDFVRDTDIAGLGSDTLCNEQAHSTTIDAEFPLHVMLQRDLGMLFHEALWLEDWAEDCAEDGRYEAFYVAAPLRLVGGTGAPMNPIVIK